MQLELAQGDITRMRVDAIVNAANSSLFGGGGVDGAIHKRGGRAILAECRKLRDTRFPDGLPAGRAVATTAGKLDAKWVIHTVGPIYRRGDAETLRSCYSESLAVAAELGAQTVAFPLISAGAFGWPVEDAIVQARDAIRAAPNAGVAILVLFAADTLATAQRLV
ncbi:O-acetyl-ADP-ribose deacetylase [Jatrophihabitans sp.]|uniref:O-acetyl-ADP-ribose deacetylase n=1 Tax=Jatrophihabitans sp. TaxID=1932789 RepID=UPI0030C74D52|nr:RNase inhibitor [Jatrophihabitans sp.]